MTYEVLLDQNQFRKKHCCGGNISFTLFLFFPFLFLLESEANRGGSMHVVSILKAITTDRIAVMSSQIV